jgi:hypothetical protein
MLMFMITSNVRPGTHNTVKTALKLLSTLLGISKR